MQWCQTLTTGATTLFLSSLTAAWPQSWRLAEAPTALKVRAEGGTLLRLAACQMRSLQYLSACRCTAGTPCMRRCSGLECLQQACGH